MINENDMKCQTCDKELIRKQYDSGVWESMPNFRKRKFCSNECKIKGKKAYGARGYQEPPRPPEEIYLDAFIYRII